DLQEVIGREAGFTIDTVGFEAELDRARTRSQGSKVNEPEIAAEYRSLAQRSGAIEFVGYDQEEGQSEILAILVDGHPAEQASAEVRAQIVTRATPFYAEKGGQVGDRGKIVADQSLFEVEDTKAPLDDLVVHIGILKSGNLRVGQQ